MAQIDKIFNNSHHECSVCFENKIGSEFIKLNECKHYFCTACLSEHAKLIVAEGTITKLK